MFNKPRVGVTGPDRGGFAAWVMTWLALYRAGAKAIRITPSRPCAPSTLNAIVIGGGTDVEPVHYGEEPLQQETKALAKSTSLKNAIITLLLFFLRKISTIRQTQDYDSQRDMLEAQLIEHALEHDKPLLGICRGAQLLNIKLGGSLFQNIKEFYTEIPHVRTLLPRKHIRVKPDTKLFNALREHDCVVNALHDQAIRKLGDRVRVTARDKANVIQAIEHLDHLFVVGVQWHPEYLPQVRQQQRLFRHLVNAAIARETNNREQT